MNNQIIIILFLIFHNLTLLGSASMINPHTSDSPVYFGHIDGQGTPLDKKIIHLMKLTNGIFIEVGANDGTTQSNTKSLEIYYGWKGILIEPSEILFPILCKNRPNSFCFQCALGNFSQNNTYIYGDFDGGLMASIQGTRLDRPANQKVLIRSLQSILDELKIQHVNFFSLDTEGYELNILHGIDFEKTCFDYMLIEIYKNQYEEIVSFLLKHNYEMIQNFSNYNLTSNPKWDGLHNDYLFKKIK